MKIMTETNFDPNKVAVDVATNLITKCSDDLYSFLKNKVTGFRYKSSVSIGNAFIPYLESIYRTQSITKTFLNTKTPVPVEDIFVNTSLRHDKDVLSTKSIIELMSFGHNIVISGTGGIGKTTLLRHYMLNVFYETDLIPVFVELRKIDLNSDVSEQIYHHMTILGFKLEEQYFKYSLERGKYIFLLDGYDEIDKDFRTKLGDELIELSNLYPDNYYIITSRPNRDQFLRWNTFIEFETLKLNKKESLELIRKCHYDNQDVKMNFYNALETQFYDKYKSFASIPLLLIIMLLTYEGNAKLPDDISEFYEEALHTLFSRHDAGKEFCRKINCRLGFRSFESVFSYFCFYTYWESTLSFTHSRLHDIFERALFKLKLEGVDVDAYISDLVESVCMLSLEGIEYHFVHRSFQEYYAALYISKLPDRDLRRLVNNYISTHSVEILEDRLLIYLYTLIPERFTESIFLPKIKSIKTTVEKYSSINIGLLHVFCVVFHIDFTGPTSKMLWLETHPRFEKTDSFFGLMYMTIFTEPMDLYKRVYHDFVSCILCEEALNEMRRLAADNLYGVRVKVGKDQYAQKVNIENIPEHELVTLASYLHRSIPDTYGKAIAFYNDWHTKKKEQKQKDILIDY